jgi:succinylglutamic semialdehyde dehydrogenase
MSSSSDPRHSTLGPCPLSSINPADGSVVWQGQAAGQAEIGAAMTRAREAFRAWSARPFMERIGFLRQFGKALDQHKQGLAETIAREIGKPLWEARTEVGAMIGKIEISIRAHEQRCAEFTGGPAVTRFRPHGVVAVLGPYNVPGHLPNGHIIPALLAGNVVLFKPSELAPATAEATMACWQEAGLPGGVLQILQGNAQTAKLLTAHPQLDGLFFTGSARTGKLLARQFAETPGRILALEMGGNNPLIVDPGHLQELQAAAEVAIHSAFLSAGQRCTCARRLIVIDSPKSENLLSGLIEKTRALRVADPFADPPPFMGPLASIKFPEQVLAAQTNLIRKGGFPLLEAERGKPGTGFISPGIIDVSGVEDLPDEEIFGPLLQVIRVADLEAAVNVANNTRYGLAAGILTDSAERYKFAYPRLRAGIINWNTPLTGASSAAPFGGIGDSGNLRPSAYLAADYCSHPVASIEKPRCEAPERLP